MPIAIDRLTTLLRYLLIVVTAVGAAFASSALFTWILAQYAIARFWEPWVIRYGVAASSIPVALIALASGTAVGAVVGLVLGHRSSGVAPLAGALVTIWWLSSALTYSGDGPPVWSSIIAVGMLAVGLIIGGICARHLRHA
jgi:hypothetical protein